MAEPRIVSINLTHLVEAALHGQRPREAHDREEDGPLTPRGDRLSPGTR